MRIHLSLSEAELLRLLLVKYRMKEILSDHINAEHSINHVVNDIFHAKGSLFVADFDKDYAVYFDLFKYLLETEIIQF